jgi:Zn-dependent M16 (insulinase) family peptidase
MGAKAQGLRNYVGYFRVARSILSYEYLWNTVRVEGGAYGTGFVPRRDGSISFYSYRDPSPARSLECYKASTAYLRQLAENEFDLTKFIIGAVGEFDMLTTPRTASIIATTNYLNGWTAADEQRARDMMLSMTCADLNTVADIIDTAMENPRTVTVGSKEHLDSLPQKPETVIEI